MDSVKRAEDSNTRVKIDDVLSQKLEAERTQDEEDQLLYMQMCDDNQQIQQQQNDTNNPEYQRRQRKAEAELMANKSRKQYGRLIKKYAISLIKDSDEEDDEEKEEVKA